RMAAGGHFLSDILWSGYLVFLVAYGLYYGWYRRIARHSQAIDR
ncbi:MAG: PAP2 family protein, partial [Methylococcaceae bacterium]|nr:PAP2 family protein [Methylococcaceae bacterium]